MSFNAIFNGAPVGVPSPGAPAEGIDVSTGAEWVALAKGNGWQPESGAFAKAAVLGVTAAQASLLVVTAPVSGVYRADALTIQAAAGTGNSGSITVTYTDVDTGGSIGPVTFVTGAAGVAVGTTVTGSVLINAKAGTTITIAAASNAQSTNIKARIEFLG